MSVKQFKHTPDPYYLPNFKDAISWSLPFISEKGEFISDRAVRTYT